MQIAANVVKFMFDSDSCIINVLTTNLKIVLIHQLCMPQNWHLIFVLYLLAYKNMPCSFSAKIFVDAYIC